MKPMSPVHMSTPPMSRPNPAVSSIPCSITAKTQYRCSPAERVAKSPKSLVGVIQLTLGFDIGTGIACQSDRIVSKPDMPARHLDPDGISACRASMEVGISPRLLLAMRPSVHGSPLAANGTGVAFPC